MLRAIAIWSISTAVLCQTPSAQDRQAAVLQAVERNPSSSRAHFDLGEMFVEQKNYQSAANEFRAALSGDLQPPALEAWSHFRLAQIFDATQQWERAALELQFVLATDDATLATEARKQLEDLSVQHGIHPQPIAPRPRPDGAPLTHRVEGEYTEEARLAGLEGVVAITGVLNMDGAIGNAVVIQPLGLGLTEKALKAVQTLRFAPPPVATPVKVGVEFLLPEKQSRWHLVRVDFETPEHATPPKFFLASYPLGVGVKKDAIEHGQLVVAMRRSGTAILTFQIDEIGRPGQFQVLDVSNPIWGREAEPMLAEWRFTPAMLEGKAVPAQCTVVVAWGARNIPAQALGEIAIGNPGPPLRLDPDSYPALVTLRAEAASTEEASRARVTGSVVLEFLIEPDGSPSDIRVARGLGYGLDERAIEAVRKWRFRYREEKTGVRAYADIPFGPLNSAQ